VTSPPPGVPDETRADVARRRLAELAEAFDARWHPDPLPESRPDRRPPGRRSGGRHVDRADRGSIRPRLRDRHVALFAVLGLAALVLIGWWLLAGRPERLDEPAVIEAESSEPAASTEDGASELVVHVTGDVEKPGIVTVPVGSRVHEAIEAAGGVTGDPDLSGLNLARELADGEQVLVGRAAQPAPGEPGGAVNVNTADSETLQELPGVGPVTAAAIIARRTDHGPFRSVDDLLDVKGIGEATLAELRDHVTV